MCPGTTDGQPPLFRLIGVKSSRQWILYSLIRIGIFAVALAALLLLVPQVAPWISAIIAAVIGLCLAYIFFRPQRDAVVRSFVEFRTTEHRDTDSDEDDALDASGGPPGAAGLEGERRREGDPVEQGGEARELEGEDELGGGLPGERDDDRR